MPYVNHVIYVEFFNLLGVNLNSSSLFLNSIQFYQGTIMVVERNLSASEILLYYVNSQGN